MKMHELKNQKTKQKQTRKNYPKKPPKTIAIIS